jgi:hypothetical protein
VAKLRFRDRFFTRQGARAITSPLGIVLFGGVTAAGIVAGIPLLVAPVIGLAAWAGKVLLSVPRNKKGPRIDPYVLSEPWRQSVLSAQSARARFDRTVAATRPGPLKDRLTEMGRRLEDGLEDSWRVALRGDELDAAINTLNDTQARAELAELRMQVQQANSPAVQQTIESLEAQIASADRLRATRRDVANRLRLLDERFDEVVARAVEVSVGGDTGELDEDVTGLVTDLEALRRAVEDVDRAAEGRTELPPPSAQPEAAPPTEPQSQTFPPTNR